MKDLRQIHLYLGCVFAPLIIYFSLSGAWQIFRFNDIPKDKEPTAMQSFFHELSKPHKSSTLPGENPNTEGSFLFNWIALFMSAGLIITTLVGLVLAFRFKKSPRLLYFCVALGTALPIALLFLK